MGQILVQEDMVESLFFVVIFESSTCTIEVITQLFLGVIRLPVFCTTSKPIQRSNNYEFANGNALKQIVIVDLYTHNTNA